MENQPWSGSKDDNGGRRNANESQREIDTAAAQAATPEKE